MTEKVKKNNDVIWSKEQMESLLHLHEQEIELWDISNPIYSKKGCKTRSSGESKRMPWGYFYW
jgi:hypothetical protein